MSVVDVPSPSPGRHQVVRTATVLALLAAALSNSSCEKEAPHLTAKETARKAYCGANYADIEQHIDETIAQMTLDDKAQLMHGNLLIPDPETGTWNTAGLEELGIPGFHMLDGPRGLSRFSGQKGAAFPVAMARGATWSESLERQVGEVIGAELRLAGADVLLAPTVNVLRHPRWGRAQETYGEDPFHIGALGTAFVLGAQKYVMAVAKHFALNSIENTRLEVNVNVDERTLREIYLPHFERMVHEGQVAGIMTSYNRINGQWGSEQSHLIADILRGEWLFQGFTVSDWLWGTHETVPALEAGLDVEMQIPQIYGESVVEAVNQKVVAEALVDRAVRNILRAQWCFVHKTVAPTITELEGSEALELAKEVAARSMVLLENRHNALPIDRTATPTIAVVGSLADEANTGDRGSSHVESSSVTTMLAGLRAQGQGATVKHVVGDLTASADQDAVKGADVVVAVVGYSADEEGEGQIAAGDRESMGLPADDLAVIKLATELNDRVVVVMVGGSSIDIVSWRESAEAIVMAWYSGAKGGDALADLLYGNVNFSGRLPITFAASEQHLPTFDNVSKDVTYDYFHGYRRLQRDGHKALYPFGFGRSYTGFQMESLKVLQTGNIVVVELSVSNTGAMAGLETVQLYVGGPGSAEGRAPRDLKAFAQVALEPGATETVRLEVPMERLRVWDDKRAAWMLVSGDYRFEVGTDVETLPLNETITLSN